MSLDATRWAWKQRVTKSAAKLVLLALADRSDALDKSFPSINSIADDTELNRKTIISSLDLLEALGLIEDTGERRGSTGQVKVYQLIGVEGRHSSTESGTVTGQKSASKKARNGANTGIVKESQKRNSTKNGTVPILPAKSTVFSSKESQKRDTEPTREPIRNPLPGVIGGDTPSNNQIVNSKSPTRKQRLPADFSLTNQRRQAASEYWRSKGRADLCPESEFENFTAHHQAHGKTMADWDAAWRTWYCNAVKFNRPPAGGPAHENRKPAHQPFATRIREQAAAHLAGMERANREIPDPGVCADGGPFWPEVPGSRSGNQR